MVNELHGAEAIFRGDARTRLKWAHVLHGAGRITGVSASAIATLRALCVGLPRGYRRVTIGQPAICREQGPHAEIVELVEVVVIVDRKSTRLNSSHGYISYAVFCLKKKKK